MKLYQLIISSITILFLSGSGLFAQSDVSGMLSVHYSERLPFTDDGSKPNRRDPSDIIKVGNIWHIWYSRMKSEERSGYDASVWHATSTDEGKTWTEQSEAIPRGTGNDWDVTSTFTPNILYYEGKYYLYYTGAGPDFDRRASKVRIGLASADSPYGPWTKYAGNPILEPVKDLTKFDSFRIDDACLAVRGGKIWLYYKGRQWRKSPGTTKMGLAVAESPFDTYVRQNDGNPVQGGGHEVLIWMNDEEGIYSMVNHNGPEDLINTIQYAEDGINFSKVADAKAYFQEKIFHIKASGFYRQELTEPASGEVPTWGIAGTNQLQYIDIQTSGMNIYVSKEGSDQNDGSKNSPVATLQKAQELAKETAGQKAVTIYVQDGIYYLSNTLVFEPEDSGSEGREITYQAANEGKAIISGGSLLALNWEPYKDGIYQAETPEGLNIDQVFINEENQRMARYPNYDASKKTAAYQGFAADAFSKERAEAWADPTGGYIHAMHRNRWGGYHYQITGKDAEGKVTYEGGWQNNRQMGMHKEFRMVENIFEELDAPGEWYHNAKTNTLYYYPSEGLDLENAKVEIVRLRHLIEFEGTESDPVSYINLKGFVFRHAARTFMDTKEPMLRSDWALYRGGAIKLTGTEHVSILDSEFDQLGGNAIFFNNYNRDGLVKGCHIHDVGASGVCFVGDPNAVRNPLFEYKEKNDLSKIDLTPGPKTNNYPANSAVEDCLIHGIGRTERQPAGVQIEMAKSITVRDVSVYDCARAGINIGDGAWGGHLIEGCDVFNTVLETHDHGSFNSWGRDRFWRSDRPTSQKFIDENSELPFLDAMETTTIRNSRWKCEHGWDIDLDDGSSNYEIYNNLLLNGGLKFREGFRRKAWNNVIVNNGFHPHVWYNHSEDEFFSNIITGEHRAIGVKKSGSGKRVDENLFYGNLTQAKYAYTDFDWDLNSINGDPLFVDPRNGDFSVKEGSPAFQVGFKNFPMDQFGVKKASLKAIAKTPEIPEIRYDGGGLAFGQKKKRDFVPFDWLGAKLKALEGEAYSAFGVAQSDGGLAVQEVQEESILHKAGLKEDDLILAINGQPTRNRKMFLRVVASQKEVPLELTIVRNQAKRTIRFTQ